LTHVNTTSISGEQTAFRELLWTMLLLKSLSQVPTQKLSDAFASVASKERAAMSEERRQDA
jgi:hypothetical protein